MGALARRGPAPTGQPSHLSVVHAPPTAADSSGKPAWFKVYPDEAVAMVDADLHPEFVRREPLTEAEKEIAATGLAASRAALALAEPAVRYPEPLPRRPPPPVVPRQHEMHGGGA